MSTRFLKPQAMRLLAAVVCAVSAASCGSELLRTGRAPVILFVEQVSGARGNDATTFATPLLSDVQTIVDDSATIFNDVGRASLRTEMKDQSALLSGGATTISPLNAVTIHRYRVTFRRADGRNTPGVDVPFSFDGGTSATIQPGESSDVVFDLVRHASKSEPPLRNLIAGGGVMFINAIAEVTFFGRDLNGNEVTATGVIDVVFADFGDEDS
jgi:hypothetical protein